MRCRSLASWADPLPMIAARHPAVADTIRRCLESEPQSPSLAAARRAAEELDWTSGFEVPRWAALQEGLRPPPRARRHKGWVAARSSQSS